MKNINLKTIRIDGDTQSRVRLDESAVADYTQVLKDGGELPPVVVFFDGSENWLADGFHRYHAYSGDQRASIPADVRQGTRRDAMLFSFGANGAHGLRRSVDDKRKSVSAMLADNIWSTWSDQEIAKACSVSRPLVAGLRPVDKVSTFTSYPQEKEISHRDVLKKEAPQFDASLEPEGDVGPDAEELAANEASDKADREAVALILSNDEPLAVVVAENKMLKAQVASLNLRIDGLMSEKNEAVKLAKSWRLKFEKSQKAVA